ncbi:MucBP domain-containing protein [Lactiplantibacillus sp. WILCCON 0030]|uniref:MucBP domain-containing protein n=3 Tax=Lactiplantibacillus brownii TaxID=3069269 RepID=A0ABU1ACV0_9LACO|nr:MucBP domain-containing protein [Lactiplantibacillus brownii]MDQ7938242.1 MucBP domain-containing protein [Lactiplantibacillus brownii]
MSEANLEPLTQIDPSTISFVNLASVFRGGGYQHNPNGLTNAQLAQLAPWLTAIDNNDLTSKRMDFSDGSLTDLSSLRDFKKPVYIIVGGQSIDVSQPVPMVIGQPADFTATPLTGIEGENLTSRYATTWSGSEVTATQLMKQTPLVSLGNGEFEIPTVYNNGNWFSYGLHGVPYTAANSTGYIGITYPDGVQFVYDVMVYQAVNWEIAPSVTLNFVDQADQPIATAMTKTSPKIGDSYDFSNLARVAGYTFLPKASSTTTGHYMQAPQTLSFVFEKAVPAGGITVNYVDPDGKIIAPATMIKGNVGDPYTTTPATVAHYTYRQVLPTSTPATGTLALAAGTVTYEYVPDAVNRIINYVDTTTGKTLTSTTLTGAYQSAAQNPTLAAIQGYEAAGYRLVSNDFPATGSVFDSATLTKTYTVALAHRIDQLKVGDTLPTGMSLSHPVTRTITYHYADGQTAAPSVTQQVMFTRTATIDRVTAATTYSNWTAMGAASLPAVPSPMITGYQPDLAQINTMPVTATSADSTETVVYRPALSKVTVNYYLAGTKQALAPMSVLTGIVGQPYQITAPAIKGYTLATQSSEMMGHYATTDATVTFYYLPVHSTTTTTPVKKPAKRPTPAKKVTPAKQGTPAKKLTSVKWTKPETRSVATFTPVKSAHSVEQPVKKVTPTKLVKPVVQPVRSIATKSVKSGTTVMTQPAMIKPTSQASTSVKLTSQQHLRTTKQLPVPMTKEKLPQTSEQQPKTIWGLLGLTIFGLLGGLRKHKIL